MSLQPHLDEIARHRAEERPARLAYLVEQIRTELRVGVEHAARAGALLIEAKSQVLHGEWTSWLSDNFDLSERSAQNYMKLARALETLPKAEAQRVAVLPIRAALKCLAAPADRGQEDVVQHDVHQVDVARDYQPQILAALAASEVTAAKAPPRRVRWGNAVQRALDAIGELVEMQEEFSSWREKVPFEGTALTDKLDTITGIDFEAALSVLQEAEAAEIPLGFGRD